MNDKYLGLQVWRDGLAEIVEINDLTEGTILVATGTREQLEKCLITCRLMKDGSGRYLVNGIPEADTNEEAGDALEIFKLTCSNRLSGKKAFEGVTELRDKHLKKYDDQFGCCEGCGE